MFGDEIAIRAQTLVHYAANPAEAMRDAETFATAGRTPQEREHIIEANRLFISSKTADHHIQNTYPKIGVSTRGAASPWAMQHGIVG
ncbi:MAG: hypothetical protein ACRDVC_07015 [Acidimicrobiales bacterium]